MKKSDELKEAAAREDNDLRAMGLMKQSLREARYERFVEDHLPTLLKKGYIITINEADGKYTIDTESCGKTYGIIDYYPKANNLLIRRKNSWIKPGLKWLIENL
jgi:hypothetical protein